MRSSCTREPATLEQGYAQGLNAAKDVQWTVHGLHRSSVAAPVAPMQDAPPAVRWEVTMTRRERGA